MTKFEGTVNGVTYTSVQEYNTALTTAIENSEPINASSHTYTADCDNDGCQTTYDGCQTTCDGCQNPRPTNYDEVVEGYGLLSDFDLDQLDGTDEDIDVIENLKCTLNKEYAKAWIDRVLTSLSSEDVKRYVGDVTNLRDKLVAYNVENNTALCNLDKSNKELCKVIEDAHEKINNIFSQKNICEHAGEILSTEIKFFNYIIDRLNYTSTNLCKKMNESKPKNNGESKGFYNLIKAILDI